MSGPFYDLCYAVLDATEVDTDIPHHLSSEALRDSADHCRLCAFAWDAFTSARISAHDTTGISFRFLKTWIEEEDILLIRLLWPFSGKKFNETLAFYNQFHHEAISNFHVLRASGKSYLTSYWFLRPL